MLICDLTRLSSLRGKATKFRSNKSKGLFYPKFAGKWFIICQGHNHHMERLAEAINFLITKTFTRKDFYLLFAARCILSTFKNGFKLRIPFRLFFLTIDSTFFTHWKTLAFTLSADDQLVSLIGGAFQHFLRFHWDVLCPSRMVLSIKNGKSDLRIPWEPWSWP